MGNVHTSGNFIAGDTTTYGDGTITLSAGTDLNIDSNTLFVDGDNNRVGIGTTSPDVALHVGTEDAGQTTVRIAGADTGSAEGGEIQLAAAADHDVQGGFDFWRIDVAEDDLRFGPTGLTSVLITPAGDVGIGVTIPSARLDVVGTTELNGDVTINSNLTVDTDALFVDGDNNRVGIGTASPDVALHVGAEDAGQTTVRIAGADTGSAEGGEIQLSMAADHDDSRDYWRIDVVEDDLRIGPTGLTSVLITTSGDVSVDGGVSVNSNLEVGGNTDLSGYVELGSNLEVGGTTDLSGDVELGSNLDVVGRIRVIDNGPGIDDPGAEMLAIGDDTFFTDIDVANTLALYGSTNNAQAGIKLGSGGPTLFGQGGNLDVDGGVSVNSNLTVSDNTTVSGTTQLVGNVTINSNLGIGQGATPLTFALQVGEEDAGAAEATIRIAGAGPNAVSGASSAEGGQILLSMAADHDAAFDHWRIDVAEDDLRFGAAGLVNMRLAPAGDVEITTTLLPGGPNLRLGPGTVGTDAGQLEWRTTSARHWNIDQEAGDLRFFTQDANDAAGAVRMRISENAVFLGENGPANAPSRGTKLFFQGAIGDNTDTIWMARQNQSPDPIFGGDTTLLLMNIGDNGPGQADALFLTYDSIPSEDVGGSGIRVAHQLFMNGDIASPSTQSTRFW